MNAKTVSRRRLAIKEAPERLSPPIVVEPLYQCATAVTVIGFVPEAQIDVEVNGALVTTAPGGFPWPKGVTIALPNALVAGNTVRARQRTPQLTSGWSNPVGVRDHTADYPAGPPRPQIDPAPVFQCGLRTGVGNLLTGSNVWITADGAEVGRVNGASQHQGVNVNPAYGLGEYVRAWSEMCKDPSPPSVGHVTQIPPAPLPVLTFDPVYEGGQQVTVREVVNGARVALYRNGVLMGTWPCWGGGLTVSGLTPIASGDVFRASQAMCPGDPPSHPGETTALPCGALPAPQVGPVQAGDTQITLTQFVPDAAISVYLNGMLVGLGSGPVVILSRAIAMGDALYIVQDLRGCRSHFALEVQVLCVDPPVRGNPSALDLFPVGFFDYQSSGLKGRVFYPAIDDSANQPFNERLAGVRRAPIVFMAHGNHDPSDPSFLGYDYFQRDLAKMGVIAVSIDCNSLNGGYGGVQNIEDRADLIIEHIAYFQALDTTAGSIFFGHVDFARVGLMGHSRGGDAVVTVPTVIALAGVTIRAVLALAPTNFRFRAGLPTIAPQGYAFMTILPAGDGDVSDNNGAQFYDQAKPAPFKSQLYVHYTNHNYFNRIWLEDDSQWTQPQPAVVARWEHERILTSYGCALFRARLLSHSTWQYLSGDLLPSGVLTQHAHRSYEWAKVVTVDNHEDGNTIGTNSRGQPTSQLSGMSANEYAFGQDPAAYNSSFYGESTGMVIASGQAGRIFRTALPTPRDLTRREVWIRAAEVTDGRAVIGASTGFELGLEDGNGFRAWVDTDMVGGLPRPYARDPGRVKTMLQTLRFKGACFRAGKFRIESVRAILIRCDRSDRHAFALDDLQIV